jgi:hypothetical protein
MSVPDQIREDLRTRLWRTADEIAWMNLPQSEKAKLYEDWTRDPKVGGVLARYIDKGHVRVYLKDTLLKTYAQARLADSDRPFRVLDIPQTAVITKSYVKPHGRTLADGRVVCWGRAEDWKLVLMAVHERAHLNRKANPFAAVLLQSNGRYQSKDIREMVEAASRKLGIEHLVWLDT